MLIKKITAMSKLNTTETFRILKDQIIKSFPEIMILGKDYCGIKYDDFELLINMKFEITCKFPTIKNIPVESLRLFFLDRLKYSYTETYVDLDKIRVFRRDFRRTMNEKKALTSFLLAMELYGSFKAVFEAYTTFKKFNQ